MALSVYGAPTDPLQIQGGTNFYNPGGAQATPVAPVTTTSATGGGGGGGGAAAAPAVVDPSIYQYYDSLQGNVNSQLGRLPGQQQIGEANINDAYSKSLGGLQTAKAQTTRDYNTNKDQTLQDYVGAKGNIQFGVGQNANALQRLLGSHGYTGTANVGANYIAARNGAIQADQTDKTFGRNQGALDTSYNDYVTREQGAEGDLAAQRDNQKNQLNSQIAQSKQTLLGQLADIAGKRAGAAPGATYAQIVAASQPINDQINSLGSQIDQYGRNVSFNAQAPTYNAPSLDKYTYSQTGPTQLNAGSVPGAADSLNPFLNVLLGQDGQFKNLNNIA